MTNSPKKQEVMERWIELKAEFQAIKEKIDNFETDHDLVLDFWLAASTLVSLILDWIELRKRFNYHKPEPSGPTIEEVD